MICVRDRVANWAMIRNLLAWGVAVLLAAGGAIAAEEPAAPGLDQRVDRYLEPFLAAGHLSGTVLIARGNAIVYEKSFGFANRELEVPNSPRTRFGIGSVNKPMTIVILARLLEAEKLALDDKLSRFLPAFPRGDDITIDHLLNHSAGIPHRVTEPLDEIRPQTPATVVELAARKKLVFEPGSDSVYSSAGFSVLARVLELVGEKPYAALLAEHVLRPAAMADTSDVGSRAILERRAVSYSFDTDGLLNAPPGDISYLVGAGSAFSTPRDLLALQQALRSGKLGQRAQELLLRDSGDLSWNGAASGYRAFVDYHGARELTVAVASNLTSGALDRIRAALPEIAAGEEVPIPAPIRATAVAVDQAVLRTYEGSYQLRAGRNLELKIVDGRVRIDEWLLIPTSETTLFSPQDYAEIEVVRGDGGEVTRLDWKIGGQTYPLPRVVAPPADELADGSVVGDWVGQYQTHQALHGQLRISVAREADRYRITVVSSNEHYPSDEPEELVESSIEGDEIRWTLFFGPNRVEWTGRLEGDFLVGELSGSGEGHGAFRGYWTAVRSAATVRPGG